MVDELGLADETRRCTIDKITTDPRLASDHAEPPTKALLTTVVTAADGCGTRESIVNRILDQTSTPEAAQHRSCFHDQLVALPAEQLADLAAGGDASDTEARIAIECGLNSTAPAFR